jgi:hypothetical protein
LRQTVATCFFCSAIVCFWWTVPLLAFSAITVLLTAEETGYDRQAGAMPVETPQEYLANRLATFFPGTAITVRPSPAEFVSLHARMACRLSANMSVLYQTKCTAAPLLIGLSPATIPLGIFTLVIFGWVLLNDILSPVFLQTPLGEGGYGFTPIQSGACML